MFTKKIMVIAAVAAIALVGLKSPAFAKDRNGYAANQMAMQMWMNQQGLQNGYAANYANPLAYGLNNGYVNPVNYGAANGYYGYPASYGTGTGLVGSLFGSGLNNNYYGNPAAYGVGSNYYVNPASYGVANGYYGNAGYANNGIVNRFLGNNYGNRCGSNGYHHHHHQLGFNGNGGGLGQYAQYFRR